MTPRDMLDMLDFSRRVEAMSDEDLAQALWLVRCQDYVPKQSADEIVMDAAVARLRAREAK